MYKNFYYQFPFKKGVLTFSLMLLCFMSGAQTLVWKNSVTGTSTSASGRAPQSSHRYTRTVYLIAASELSAGGISSGRILKAIGFNYREAEAIATATATGELKIYLQNSTDLSYQKGTSWSNAIASMTKVSDVANQVIPASTTANFVFQNGTAFTYNGGSLYVAFEWLNLSGARGTANTAYCSSSTTNTGGANGLYSHSVSAGTSPVSEDPITMAQVSDLVGTTSNFRPATRFAYELPNNDVQVSNIYVMSKAPVNEGKQKIAARITNEGVNPIYNLSVTLTISGANTFTSTKAISLPVETPLESGAGYNVTFDEFISVNQGNNSITVTINNADDVSGNNTMNRVQASTPGVFSYNIGEVITSNGGSSTQGYKYAVKYTANGTVYPKAARFMLSTNATVVGKQLRASWYNSSWVLMGTSDLYTATAEDQGKLVLIPFTANNIAVPNIAGSTDFYVSIEQTSTTGGASIFFMGRQNELETPAMEGAYFGGINVDPGTGLGASTSKPTIEAITTLAILPVTISTFTAKPNNNKVALNWTVGIETNVNRYEIERSINGVDFIKVAEVAANGSSSYSTIDANPVLGINYYRLKGIDNDGTFSHFNEVRSAKITTLEEESAVIYPNPVVGNEVNVALSGYSSGNYSYKILNALGSIVQSGQLSNNGSANYTISLKGQISKGIYVLYLTNGKEVIQSKFIKN